MTQGDSSADELRRLATLHALGLLDTPAEERFDRITRMAQRLFGAPIALISLVDEERQWFKSRQGLEAVETPRNVSFCAHAIKGSDPMVVPDASDDARFADNPLVVDDPHIRFYAGCPIASPDGTKLGTLCVIDRRPRDLDAEELTLLRDLAALVETEIAALHTSIIDELTGLTNRRGFELIANKVLALCTRRSLRATVMYADLDNLKPINDTLGHEAGDQALIDTARVLTSAFRASDVVARIGGDEFATFLTGSDDTPSALARLTRRLDEHNAAAPGRVRLSLSIGAAEFDPSTPEPLDSLVRRADAAMYQQKLARKEGGPYPPAAGCRP